MSTLTARTDTETPTSAPTTLSRPGPSAHQLSSRPLDILVYCLFWPQALFTMYCWRLVQIIPKEELTDPLLALTPWWSQLDAHFLATSDIRLCVFHLLQCFYYEFHTKGVTSPAVRHILECGFTPM